MPQSEIPRINLETERLYLRTIGPEKALDVTHYWRMNRAYFQESGPLLEDNFFTPAYQEHYLRQGELARRRAERFRVYLILKSTGEMVGDISLTNIFWGGFRSGVIGYKTAQDFAGKGLMTEALVKIITWIFEVMDLQRIEANIRPDNAASLRVVAKLGFRVEGLSPEYLEINGERKDHLRMTLLRSKWEGEKLPSEWSGFESVLPSWSSRVRMQTRIHPREGVLLAQVEGSFRVGALGNPDGEYLFSEAYVGIIRSGAVGIIWDFRKMDYTWGDSMVRLANILTEIFPGERKPVAMILSDRNREGLASLFQFDSNRPSAPFFSDSDAAFQWMKKSISDYYESV